MTELVGAGKQLDDILQSAAECGYAAVDTEFVWTRTYYPILGLIQIATGNERIWLIDPFEIQQLSPLSELVASPDIVNILHDASGDLAILSRLFGVLPARIFDTRLAAGFCGLSATLSLSNLLEEILGIELPKTESLTDWTQRPLSDAQRHYALDDVRHMPELYHALLERLDTYGTREWALEEMRAYEDPDVYRATPPEKAYRAIKGMGRLRPQELAVLREVAAWRERSARDLDLTRSRLLRNITMLDIARRKPNSKQTLRNAQQLQRRTLKQHADDILACVQRARDLPEDQYPTLPSCPLDSKELKRRADSILAVVRKRAKQWGVDPVLVASRRSANALVLAKTRDPEARTHPLENGWRAALLDGELDPVVANFS